MNCKPGDIARIVRSGKWLGYMVSVIELAPDHAFTLPDGQKHRAPVNTPSWVCEAMGAGFPARVVNDLGDVQTRHAKFVCIADMYLRPIRDPGDDACDETLDWVGVPSEVSHV